MNKLNLLGLLALTLSTVSCVDDGFGREDWHMPPMSCENKFAASNISLKDFVALAPSNGSIVITEDYIIDGYVISSDENGSFYKTIVFQDSPENPTTGLQIEVNKSSNYADFPVGSHIRISTKGLVLGTDRGVVKLGSNDPNYTIGRIHESQVGNYISMVCANGKADIANIVPLELSTLTEARNPQYINKLVSVSDVQFSDADVLDNKTYIDLSPKQDTDRELVDKDGRTATLRTSQYASYGAELLPKGKGKITFVVSRYNNNYQMMIRSTKDINFTEERVDIAPAKGGTSITYLKAGDTENFTSFTRNADSFPGYINDPVIGNRYWRVAEFGGNKYIQLGYGATGAKPYARTLFAVPVDFDNMTRFSFTSKDGNNNGDVLKVYYSTDYTANNIANSTLVDITGSFAIAKGTANGYAANFTASGFWDKPSTLTGKGFIIFEYNGGGKLPTTTIQIDDISIQ